MRGTITALALAAALAGCDGDGHADHDGHEGHAGEDHVILSPGALAAAGLGFGNPAPGRIVTTLELPGEVIADPDRIAHVTPRAAGSAIEVPAVLGSRVKAGEVLAVIESPELGAAKIDHLEALRTREVAAFDHGRQEGISRGTDRLLALLAAEPEPAKAREAASDLVIGDDKARLLTAYSNLHLARRSLGREEDLARRKVNSESEVLAARNAHDTAAADYSSARESVAFAHRGRLLEAEKALGLADAALRNRERRLHLLGVPEGEIGTLGTEPDDRIARYTLRSPIDGVVVEKHLVLGENVDTGTGVFVVADLDRVLLRFSVPPAELSRVRAGQPVRVRVDGVAEEGAGKVDFLSPVADERTRMAEGRVVLENPGGLRRPGLFGSVRILIEDAAVGLSLPAEAVFRHEGREVVFVEEGERTYEPRPVRIGRRDAAVVEILEGAEPGDRVVVKNAFILKAELGKGAGGHDH